MNIVTPEPLFTIFIDSIKIVENNKNYWVVFVTNPLLVYSTFHRPCNRQLTVATL